MGKSEEEKNHSVIIKLDGVSKQAGQKVLAATIDSARKNAAGARGSFVIAPTRSLKGRSEMDLLGDGKKTRATEVDHEVGEPCRKIMADGRRCSAARLDGNYGFCGRHR